MTNAVGVGSRIEAVTVYRRGARITRIAELEVGRGGEVPPAVRLGGLPLGLDDDSVRVRVEALEGDDGAALPVAADLRVALDVPQRDESLLPADPDQLEAARLELRRLEWRARLLEAEHARLHRLAIVERPSGAEGQPPPASPTEARRSLIRFRVEREQASSRRLAAVRADIEAATRRRARLEDENRRATSARQAREHELRKSVVVSLRRGSPEANADLPAASSGMTPPGSSGGVGHLAAGDAGDGARPPGRVRLAIEYLVPGASWAPVYALRIAREMDHAELGLRAMVAQRSGEDWTAARLTLSTALPPSWADLPELSSLRIGRRQPPVARLGWRSPPPGTDELYRDHDRAFGGPGTSGGFDEITAVSGALDSRAGDQPADPLAGGQVAAEFDDEVTVNRWSSPPGAPAGGAVVVSPPPAMAAARPAPPTVATVTRSPRAGVAPPASVSPAPAPLAAQAAPRKKEAPASRGMAEKAKRARPTAADDSQLEPEPDGPAELGARAELLRYGNLRMAPGSSLHRGHLRPADRIEAYLSLLMEWKVEVRFDVLAAVEGARGRAQVLPPVPPGCEPPGSGWSDGFDYAYAADAPVDLPSDGEYHSIPLMERRAAVVPRYVVVPRQLTDVFRTAEVDNPLEAPLLPGPVDVYLGSDFLLTSRIDATPQSGRVTVGLGVEGGIQVARNARFREESAGLMGGSLLLNHHIAVEMRNNLGRAAPIEVRERIPVARDGDDDVEVIEQAVSPAWEEWRPAPDGPGQPELRGGRRWRVTVPAGGRQDLRADYQIRISSKLELSGGNRREA